MSEKDDDEDRDSDEGERDSDAGDRDSDRADARDSDAPAKASNGSGASSGERPKADAHDDDDDDDDDDSDRPPAKESSEPRADHAHDKGHGHDDHGRDAPGHDGHGLAHTTPVTLLGAVLATLLVLTVITVAATYVDLGKAGNLSVAMVIATIKSGLVITFFMHLKWDKLFHTVAFLSSLLFVILFVSLAITDRSEYQPDMEAWEADQAAQ